MPKLPMKNVTPKAGAPTRAAARPVHKPAFRSDKPQPRSKGGRGNEMVSNDDVMRTAEQSLTSEAEAKRWERVPNAIEYLRRYVEHLEVLARAKDKLDPMKAVRLMDQVRTFKEQVSEMVKSPAEKIFDILRFTVVPEIFLDNDIPSLTLDGIGRVNIMDDLTVTIIGEDNEKKENQKKFQGWLIENELEDLITPTVNAQTLAAFVRRTLRDPDSKLHLPMDLLKITPVTRAQITRV